MFEATHFFIKNNSRKYEEVTNIILPDSLTSIKNYTFAGFKNLTSINIPSGVLKIGKGVFL